MSDNSQRLPVTFPGDVHEALRKAAFVQHVSMAAIVVEAVREKLRMTAEEEARNAGESSSPKCWDCGEAFEYGTGYGDSQVFCSESCAATFKHSLGA